MLQLLGGLHQASVTRNGESSDLYPAKRGYFNGLYPKGEYSLSVCTLDHRSLSGV